LVYAVTRPAFIECRRPRRDAAADDVDRLSQNISATVTRRHLRHDQSNYFIGTSSIHCAFTVALPNTGHWDT